MKKQFLGLYILAAFAAVLFFGSQMQKVEADTAQTVPEQLPYSQVYISFSEPQGEVFNVKNGWGVDYNGVSYCFVNEISESDRNTTIRSAALLLQKIQDLAGILPDGCTMCIRQDDYLPRVQDHTLYIGFKNLDSPDFAIGLAQMVLGNEVPYGLEYAMGTRIAEALGYPIESPAVNLDDALALCDTAPVYLDMNYACFLDVYADSETLPRLKQIALSFFDYLVENEKNDLFSNYSNEKYRAYLNGFLSANGKAGYDNSDLDGTVFYNGGQNIRLVWENRDGVFYVYEGYHVLYHKKGPILDTVNSCYPDLRNLIKDYIAQAAYMREVLKDFEPNTEPVTVKFIQNSRFNYYAGAMFLGSEIQLYSVEAFQHEYGHYLLRERGIDNWLQECFCHYYTYAATTPELAYMWYYDMITTQALDPNNPEDAERYAFEQEIAQHLGHEVDWYSMDDYVYDWNAYLMRGGKSLTGRLLDEKSGTGEKVCFFHFLTSLQTEKSTLQAIWENQPEEVFGKSWGALRLEWVEYCKKEFAWAQQPNE